MDLSTKALIGIIAITLVLLIVIYPLAPSWFMAFPILFGIIAFSFDKRRRRSPEDRDSRLGSSSPPRPPTNDGGLQSGSQTGSPQGDDGLFQNGSSSGDVEQHLVSENWASLPHRFVSTVGGMRRRKREYVSSSSTSSSYDVFLSFRGTDIPRTFLDHLRKALVSAGITVFMDNEQLGDDKQRGDNKQLIAELNRATSPSRTYIPILSIDYASSKWCLRELAMMLECKRSYGKTIMPIFYDVSPSDVRDQAGDFGRAFNLHQDVGVDSNTMETWRMGLREVGNISGYSLNSYKGYESQLIEVVLRVARMLRDDGLAVTEKLFGVHHHIQEIMRKLGVAYGKGQATEVRGQEVRAVGLWGVKGIGKTTLAKAIYNDLHKFFESHSFLEGISLKGVRFSQQMLIADLQKGEPAPLESSDEGIKILASQFITKRVLIVLDDVDDCQQIEALVGKGNWFSSGSRIIVTTKGRHVLEAYGIVEEHEVEPMSVDHALQLFRHHAFQGDAPEEVSDPEYDSLSKDIVKAVGRVPGDIVHHASYLSRNMGVDNWRSTLELLQKRGNERQAAL